ncbi:MAG: DNA primase [Dehalococcoidia bacterium]|nr:MAG: DNA primase [Dehalococcoidia bacterium]
MNFWEEIVLNVDNTESLILKNLILNSEYCEKVIPFLKSEYFPNGQSELFDIISDFVSRYKKIPNPEVMQVELSNANGLSQKAYEYCDGFLKSIIGDDYNSNVKWLIDTTEKFCQDKALYLGIQKSVELLHVDGGKNRGTIPEILKDALGITFNVQIGLDLIKDAEKIYDTFTDSNEHISTGINAFDIITNGGFSPKTLNVILGGIHVGKTMIMSNIAGNMLLDGQRVLYITLEISEEEIAKRIYASTLDVDLSEFNETLDKDVYMDYIKNLKTKTIGELKIKQYPTSGASVIHFKSLLDEYELKENFIPDIIMVDYINLMTSSRYNGGAAGNDSYGLIKKISEELRGFAIEHNVPILTATQLNRDGMKKSETDMTDTAESFGLPATADWFLAINRDEELDKFKQLSCKQLKNRYTNLTLKKRFILGVDLMKQTLFDVDEKTQKKSLEILAVKGTNPQVINNTNKVEELPKPVEVKEKIDIGGARFNFS